jgi:hypothetical protein
MQPAQSQGGNASRKAPAAAPQPFTRAAREHIEPMLDVTNQMTATSIALGPFDVPAYGYMRGIWLYVTAAGGSGTATVATTEDAPWNVISEISLLDVNGAPLFGPVGGYDNYLVNKWGGYNLGDPKQSPLFSAVVTGANASGNYGFLLYIPTEISGRDGLGALPNANAASTFKLRITLAPSSAVYSTPPTNLPQVRVRAWLDAWTQPNATDLKGNANATQPPAMGTSQYWSKTTINLGSGYQTPRLTRVGSYIRDLIFIYRDGSGSRSAGAALFPQDVSIYWDSKNLKTHSRDLWKHQMARRTKYFGAAESSGGIDNGVWVEDYMHEFDGMIGNELRDGWLGTVQSTRLEMSGQFTGAGVLTIITNDVAPAGQIFTD